MLPAITVQLDTRRVKKNGMYPLKLRVYYKNKTILYPIIYDLSNEDYERLKAKRVSNSLAEIREKIMEIEFHALAAAKKIMPFDNDKFFNSFIRDNVLFIIRDKKKNESTLHHSDIYISEEWKKAFAIFSEIHPGPEAKKILSPMLNEKQTNGSRLFTQS